MDPTSPGDLRAAPTLRHTAPRHLVPPDSRLTGRWHRSLLQTAEGGRDTTSQVAWLQAGGLYVDLRLPAQHPDLGHVTCLRALYREQAVALAQIQGFAGRLLADGPFAHWERLVDLQPATPHPDQGRLVEEGDRLIETGRDASYVEHWHRGTAHTAPLAALLLREMATGALAVLVRVGDDVGWARGRTLAGGRALASGRARALGRPGDLTPLAGQVRAAPSDHAAQDLLDTEVAFGRIEPHGVTLTRSNLPWRVGAPLAMAAMAAVGERVSTEDVAPDGSTLRHIWKVLSREGDLADVPFRTLQESRP